MTPESIFFAVRALIRLGDTTREMFAERRRNKPFVLPQGFDHRFEQSFVTGDDPFYDAYDYLERRRDQYFQDLLRDVPELGDKNLLPELPAFAKVKVMDVAQELWLAEQPLIDPMHSGARDHIGLYVMRPWINGEPVNHGYLRLGLELADIGLEYASANPGLFSASANGEKMVQAVTLHMRELLPSPEDLSNPQEAWMERAMSVFFRAGLNALHVRAQEDIDEEHMRDLALGVLMPVREMLDASATDGRLPRLSMLRETMLGPVADAAVGAVSRHKKEFLGIDESSPLGALTGSVFDTAMETNALSVFSQAGMMRVFHASLEVVSQRPAIFIPGDTDRDDFLRDILTRTTDLMLDGTADGKNPFDKDFGTDLVVAALESVAEYAPRKFDDTPWNRAAGDMVESVLRGFASSFEEGTVANISLSDILSRDMAVELARIVFVQAAKTPQMLVGPNASDELQRIAAGVAEMLADPNANLLSPEDWRVMVSTMMEECARNPGVLFAIAGDEGGQDRLSLEGKLAVSLVSDMLHVASASLKRNGGRKMGVVLFGETLREACEVTLRAAGGNVRSALVHGSGRNRDAAIGFAKRLTLVSEKNPGVVGGREWLHIYRMWIAHVMDTGETLSWDDEDFLSMLSQEKLPAFAAFRDGSE